MGNKTSLCAPSILTLSHNATKVVLAKDGTRELYTRPIKAAELMLENPGTFVCDASSLVVGHRIQPLLADNELLKRHLYFLLPMDLLYSVLTLEEFNSFTSNSSRLSHNNTTNCDCESGNVNVGNSLSSFGKCILPSLGEFCLFLPSNSEKKNRNNDNVGTSDIISSELSSNSQPQFERFLSKQRSWTPALETIVETPTSSCRSH